MQQLKLYHDMQTPEDVESAPVYQKWLYQREVESSRACGQAPEVDKIRFEDEHVSSSDGNQEKAFEFRCRKCRKTLATSQYILDHTPSSGQSAQGCAHYFLDPLSWMKPELEQEKLDGRLNCPKCKTNVGKYAWQGMQCSCGEWVVPGISLAKGRLDEQKASRSSSDSLGIRMPPGMPASKQRSSAQENL